MTLAHISPPPSSLFNIVSPAVFRVILDLNQCLTKVVCDVRIMMYLLYRLYNTLSTPCQPPVYSVSGGIIYLIQVWGGEETLERIPPFSAQGATSFTVLNPTRIMLLSTRMSKYMLSGRIGVATVVREYTKVGQVGSRPARLYAECLV